MKICIKCNLEKSKNDFHLDRCRPDGLYPVCKICRVSLRRKAYERNKQKILAQNQAYKAAHKEELRQKNLEYGRKNRKEISRRQLDKIHSNIQTKIAHNLRSRIRIAIKRGYKGGSAVRDLGCSIDSFIKHIERKFKDGMTWDNYGKWHLDHINPLANFDLTDRSQFMIAAHYSNYQPLWAEDNLSKGDR